MGQAGSLACDVIFEDCRVPAENIIGEEGEGFVTAMKVLDRGRLHISGVAVGLAERLSYSLPPPRDPASDVRHRLHSLTIRRQTVIHIPIHQIRRKPMRTNIELDQKLVREAQRLSRIKTKKALVHQALLEFVANRKRLDLRDLKGSYLIDEGYDHKVLRQAGG